MLSQAFLNQMGLILLFFVSFNLLCYFMLENKMGKKKISAMAQDFVKLIQKTTNLNMLMERTFSLSFLIFAFGLSIVLILRFRRTLDEVITVFFVILSLYFWIKRIDNKYEEAVPSIEE
ncbi:hypothetical protein MWH28_12265 [Natroniella sulfidigena]|uniref:hypothetical protein n=1 Tax=Natroniella sulfidigena TaxID=723921 RepID=UPI00200A630E|nr:hypothetical protein [Natroniella sulfidigena]MCK8818131.1 hypothetical protein [Natroniella sulfidigena]